MDMKNCEYWVSHYAVRQELKRYFFGDSFMILRDLLFDLDCDNEFLFYSTDQFNKAITEFYEWYEPLDIARLTDIKENDAFYTITRVFDIKNRAYNIFKGYTFDEMIDVFKLNIDYLLDFIIDNCWSIPLCKEYKYVISIIDEYKDNYAYDMISEYIKDNVNDDDFKLDDYFIDMIGRDEYEALVEEYKDNKEEC